MGRRQGIWTAHRYGREKPRPIIRRLSERQVTRLVDRRAAIMRAGMERGAASRFAFEAPIRAGLRAGLCLAGWRWHEADVAAVDVTLRALARIGATRPSWQEGQPEWTEQGVLRHQRENCARCGKRIPEERQARSIATPAKYCSMLCTNAAKVDAHRKRQGDEFRVKHAAEVLAQWRKAKESTPQKPCAYCGDLFHPTPAKKDRPETIYCSPRCRNKARSRYRDPVRGGILHPADR